jgi:glutathione S-transferase
MTKAKTTRSEKAGAQATTASAAPLAPASAASATPAMLTLSSKNYSSWSLRGWLLVRFAGLPVTEKMVPIDDASAKAELLLLSPSVLVPRLEHAGISVWDTLAIGEYLHEIRPEAGLLPSDPVARSHCRSICGEMHSGFSALRSALPMNVTAKLKKFTVWSRAKADIERITEIWRDCLARYGGPWLFGKQRSMADAMYAPVVTRFLTYNVALDPVCAAYCETVMAMPEMQEWIAAAKLEPIDIEELEVEF